MSWFVDPINFWLVATRISGFFLMIPALSQVPIPRFMRALLVGWCTLAILPSVPTHATGIVSNIDLSIAAAMELLFGMGMGFVIRQAFAVIEIGGTMIDTELGYRLAEQVNPSLAISGGVMGRFLVIAAMFYFWSMDYFSLLILGLRESFVMIPPLTLHSLPFDLQNIIKLSAGLFASALVLAAPILGLMFAITVGIGFLSRAVQGMNMFFEVFTLKILVGLGATILLMPLLLMIMRDQLTRMIPNVHHYLNAFANTLS